MNDDRVTENIQETRKKTSMLWTGGKVGWSANSGGDTNKQEGTGKFEIVMYT